MDKYKRLNRQKFNKGVFSIVPIRYQDRLKIMKWRNEQLYHLRQPRTLTVEEQDNYFNTTIKSLFSQNYPSQILFSYLEKDVCIGYGGLVHINWTHKIGEVSFIMTTSLEGEKFAFHWSNFLILLEKVVFEELKFRKMSTYAYDLRPHLYPILEDNGYIKEEILKGEHTFEGNPLDVVIHSKYNPSLKM